MDNESVELMVDYLKESSRQSAKIAEMEANQKNIIAELTNNETKFASLFGVVGEVKSDTAVLVQIIKGDYSFGLVQKVANHEEFLQRIVGIINLFKFAGIGSILAVILWIVNILKGGLL